MVEQDGAALPPAASDQGDVGANNGNEEWKQLPPFFSMCQLPVIYPNPWGAVHDEHELPSPGPPSSTETEPPVSVVLDVAENIWDVLSTEIEQPSSPILSSKQLDFNSDWDGKYNQHSSNQANSSVGLEDLRNKQPPSPSFIWQLQSVGAGLWNMGNTCFLNATLQCITHTVPLLMTLCSTNHSIPCPCMDNCQT